ncbi:hypothetical protein L9F63_001123 [Diploptera punctata]|uniref:Ionotropic glutamate receptor C-terminal domain-containing protein n=1 Tax=Diploptera punctata TaxID=6984 RepID=A0AAD8A4I8_DIPPU|nr:hypothetical protein L9F63_001123 [Diploptera punctata]
MCCCYNIDVVDGTQREKEVYFHKLDQSFSHMWASFLCVSVPCLPKSPKLRTLFFIWVIYCLHINILYLSFLTSFMINPGSEHQVSSVEELIHSTLQYGYHNGFDKYFNDPTDNLMVTILNHRKHCEGDGTRCLLRMVIKRDFSILVSKTLMEFKNRPELFGSDGKPLYTHFRETFLIYDFVMYLTKGNPLLEKFDNIINRVVEAGLIDQWWEEMKTSIRLSRETLDQEDETSTLTLSNLVSVFVFLFIGIGLSFLIFVTEVLWFHFHKMFLYLTV